MRCYYKISLLIICLVMILMFISNIGMCSEYKLSDKRYVDPKGYFKIIPPEGWQAEEFPNDPRGKVKFVRASPPGTMLQIIAQASSFNNLQELQEDAERAATRVKQKYGATTNIEDAVFAGIPAKKIILEIPYKLKQYQMQFVLNGNHYTIAYGATPNSYNEYYPIAMASFESFEPILKKMSKEEVTKHVIASKIRTAQNLIQLGQKDYALIVINEGLVIDGNNNELLKLKRSIADHQ